jgi:HEPN domain-containing protein
MLTEDYIMRMINQALAVLFTALGLKKAGQYSEALQAYDQAVESLLGLNARLVKQLDDQRLLEILTFQEKLDLDRLLVLADIFREEAEVHALQGHPEQGLFLAQRALRLYLEASLAGDTNPSLQLIEKVEAQRAKLSAPDLPVETRLALLDYFDRLLSSGDAFLDAAGLSRAGLKASYAEIDTPDLH